MADKLHTVALGQGQAPVATRLIEDGVREVRARSLAAPCRTRHL